MLRFEAAGESHTGFVRPHNEDSGYVSPGLLLVADGVGGSAAGEVASATTAYVVSAAALRHPTARPSSALSGAIRAAQAQLSTAVATDPTLYGMATTLSAFQTDGRRVALAHMGDSRAYLFADGVLRQVSRDHTWVQQMRDAGRLTEAEASVHAWRNVVLTTVNGEAAQAPDIVSVPVQPGDRLLVCSDGVSDLVSHDWIESILRAHHDDQAATETLVGAALECGGRDNITVGLATVVDAEPVTGGGRPLGAVMDPANVRVDGVPLWSHTGAAL